MSGSLQIRGVDAELRARLTARAAAEGLSLNAHLLRILRREAEVPSRAEIHARLAARSERSAVPSDPPPRGR